MVEQITGYVPTFAAGYVPSFTAGALSPAMQQLQLVQSIAMQAATRALASRQAAATAAAQGDHAAAAQLTAQADMNQNVATQTAQTAATMVPSAAPALQAAIAPILHQSAAIAATHSVMRPASHMISSAIPTAMVPASPAQPAPLGRLPYGGSPSVEEQKPRNVRQYPLGFTQLAIPAAQTAIVTSRPQVLFRGYRLIVPTSGGSGPAPASPAVNFVIVDIRVGKNSQLVQASELPASIFQETSFDIALTMDTAQISQDIAITVRNTDAVNARDFRAVLIGAALE